MRGRAGRGVQRCAVLSLVCLLIGPPAALAQEGLPRRVLREAGEPIELMPKIAADLERIELETGDPRSTRSDRKPVSDLMLQLTAEAGDVAPLLNHPNGKAPPSRRGLFQVRVMVVSGGKLLRNARGWCGGFDGDISLCKLDCEAGRFALRRRKGSEGRRMTFLLGTLPRDIDATERPGFAIAACGLEETSEQRLVPRRGRSIIEIDLDAD